MWESARARARENTVNQFSVTNYCINASLNNENHIYYITFSAVQSAVAEKMELDSKHGFAVASIRTTQQQNL